MPDSVCFCDHVTNNMILLTQWHISAVIIWCLCWGKITGIVWLYWCVFAVASFQLLWQGVGKRSCHRPTFWFAEGMCVQEFEYFSRVYCSCAHITEYQCVDGCMYCMCAHAICIFFLKFYDHVFFLNKNKNLWNWKLKKGYDQEGI